MIVSHADDLGLHPTIDTAMIDAAQLGRLTSLSMLITHIRERRSFQNYALPRQVGIHLHINLTEGAPLSRASHIPHLINRQGEFFGLPTLKLRLHLGLVPEGELVTEIEAQIDQYQRIVGRKLTHIDTHHHIHFDSVVAPVFQRSLGHFTIRWTRRILAGKASLRAFYLNYQARRAGPSHMTSGQTYTALLDARWYTEKSLAQAIEELPLDHQFQILWHLAEDDTFPWRRRQWELLRDERWWDAFRKHNNR